MRDSACDCTPETAAPNRPVEAREHLHAVQGPIQQGLCMRRCTLDLDGLEFGWPLTTSYSGERVYVCLVSTATWSPRSIPVAKKVNSSNSYASHIIRAIYRTNPFAKVLKVLFSSSCVYRLKDGSAPKPAAPAAGPAPAAADPFAFDFAPAAAPATSAYVPCRRTMARSLCHALDV